MAGSEPRIAIVGAGGAGLSAAYYLEKRGYRDFTLFERQPEIGGKCRGLTYQGKVFDLGADFITPEYRNVLAIVREVGAKMRVVPARHSYDFERHEYRSTFTSVMSGVGLFGFTLAFVRYLWNLWKYRALQAPGFKNVPDELCVPFGQWLDRRGMGSLRNLFVIPVNVFGYAARVDELPAPIVLKYIDVSNLWLLFKIGLGLAFSWPKHLDEGFQALWERVARDWEIHKGVEIERIERGEKVTIRLRGDSTVHEFDRLIVACPFDLTLSFMDCSEEERDLFGQIVYNVYYTTAAVLNPMPDGLSGGKGTIDEMPLPGLGHPWAMVRAWPDSPLVLFFSLAAADVPRSQFDHVTVSRAEVTRLLEEDVATLRGKVQRIVSQPVWDYFPHVRPEHMRGYFDRLEALQGQRHTYYTWGLMNFETIHNVVEYSKALVEANFPERS